MKAIKKEHNSH